MIQAVRDTTRKGILLNLLPANKRGCFALSVHWCLSCHSDHEVIKLKSLLTGGKCQQNFKSGHKEFRLQSAQGIVEKCPKKKSLEDAGVHQNLSLSKDHLLRALEQTIPKCLKSSKRGRRLAWILFWR